MFGYVQPVPDWYCSKGIILPVVAKPILKEPDLAAVIALKNLKDKVQSEIQKFRGSRASPRPQRPAHMSDFARLARRICGKSIALVLGGGGARGLAHLVFASPYLQ